MTDNRNLYLWDGATRADTIAWQNAYNAGMDARTEGVRLSECPLSGRMKEAWERGWHTADQTMRMVRK